MIEKSTILITSIGRTGTEFFAKLFAETVPGCTSLHEPDIIKFLGVKNRFSYYSQQARRAGFRRMVILKALGRWTLVKLSDARFSGKLTTSDAIDGLYNQRNEFIAGMPGSVYVESNLGYYGLLDAVPQVFKNYRAIYIIRDGRDWIKSMMNWGEVYGKGMIRELFAHKWPTAKDTNDEYDKQWDRFSRFEKLCWAWSRLNEYALTTISKNPHAQVYKFEDIFLNENRYQVLEKLVSFTTSLPNLDPESLGSTNSWLERKIHQSSSQFPEWEKWSKDQKNSFEKICGPQMESLGYIY